MGVARATPMPGSKTKPAAAAAAAKPASTVKPAAASRRAATPEPPATPKPAAVRKPAAEPTPKTAPLPKPAPPPRPVAHHNTPHPPPPHPPPHPHPHPPPTPHPRTHPHPPSSPPPYPPPPPRPSQRPQASPDEQPQERLFLLSQDWGLILPPDPPDIKPLTEPPTLRQSSDDAFAEELLKLRQADMLSQGGNQKGTRTKKGWEPAFVFSVLGDHISDRGSPAVVDALLHILLEAGGNVNVAQPARHGLLLKHRFRPQHHHGSDGGPAAAAAGGQERGHLLEMAVEGGQIDMVRILAPHADTASLDAALGPAIRSLSVDMVELLLRYGASAGRSEEAQHAFVELCEWPEHHGLVGLILSSATGQPPPDVVSQAVVHAVQAGCIENTIRLTRATGSADHNRCEALKLAVSQRRRDLALALAMGAAPPHRPGLDEAFDVLRLTPMNQSQVLDLAEVLLLAGAAGDSVGAALVKYAEMGFLDVVRLLVRHGAEVEHRKGRVLQRAIKNANMDLLQILLGPESTISPVYASGCVDLLPKDLPPEERYRLLELLLRKGAAGPSLDDALIDAAEVGDVDSVELLLTPEFHHHPPVPSSKGTKGAAAARAAKPPANVQHEVASVDHKNGLALQNALTRGDIDMAQRLLAGSPSIDTLSAAFHLAAGLEPAEDRLHMVQALLEAGLAGPVVDEALHAAIAEEPDARDDQLIRILLDHGADVNFNAGEGLPALIHLGDTNLLADLLAGASQETAAAMIEPALAIEDPHLRQDTVRLLLDHCAGIALEQVLAAITDLLQTDPVDMDLLEILITEGQVDVDAYDGDLLAHALQVPEPDALNLLLSHGQPAPEHVSRLVLDLAPLPFDDNKLAKLDALIQLYQPDGVLSQALDLEVQHGLELPHDDPHVLAIVKTLLDNGACVDSLGASALCRAVAQADGPMVDLMMAEGPTPQSLAAGLPHALAIEDPMDRLTFVKRMIDAGADRAAVTDMLLSWIEQGDPADVAVADVLAAGCHDPDGRALLAAIDHQLCDVVDLLIRRTSPPPAVLDIGLLRALQEEDGVVRLEMARLLVAAGASTTAVSEALYTASSEGDVALAQLLMHEGGGQPETGGGQAIVEACRNGEVDMLHVLLEGRAEIDGAVLEEAFAASLAIEDPAVRAELFGPLLERGLEGAAVDEQLAHAAREPEEGAAEALVRVLLEGGADPNHNSGEAVWEAAANGHAEILDMLLGLVEIGGHQKFPDQATLLHALDAAWDLDRDSRFAVVEKLFAAGLEVSDELHGSLNLAVNEEQPEERLIEALLQHGASPLADGCKSLIEAVHQYDADLVSLLLHHVHGHDGDDHHDDHHHHHHHHRHHHHQHQHHNAQGHGGKYQNGAQQEDEEEEEEHHGPPVASEHELAWVFSHGFPRDDAASWYHEAGLHTAQVLLEHGVVGIPVSDALVAVTEMASDETFDLADHFVTALIHFGANPAHEDGEAIVEAASKAIAPWVRDFLEHDPPAEAVSRAFAHILDEAFPEEADALELVHPFADWVARGGGGGGGHIDHEIVRGERANYRDGGSESAGEEGGGHGEEHGEHEAEEGGEHPDENQHHSQHHNQQHHNQHPGQHHNQQHGQHNQHHNQHNGQHHNQHHNQHHDQHHPNSHHNHNNANHHDPNHHYPNHGNHYEDDGQHHQPESMLIRALQLYPASVAIFTALLDLGCDPEETAPCHIYDKIQEEEEVSPLGWVLAQPDLLATPAGPHMVAALIGHGASVNSETPLSRLTPLMLAVQAGRADLVSLLLRHGADLDVSDVMGNTPLALATHLEGESAAAILRELLTAGADTDDGSLHDAARELNLATVRALVGHGHNPDFPSPLHGGRSALGELCLHATNLGPLTALQEKAMERVIRFLLESGSDPTLRCDGKTALFLALEAPDPVGTTRVLLKAGLWKQINTPDAHVYTDGRYTYSATMYVYRLIADSPTTQQLLGLLRANRASDIFYANEGEQPADVVGLPENLRVSESERRRRLARAQAEEEEHQRGLRRSRELAKARRDLWKEQAEMEDWHRRLQHQDQLDALRERAELEQGTLQSRFGAELSHQEALTNAAAARTRLLGDAEYGMDVRRKVTDLEHERRLATLRMNGAGRGRLGGMPMRQALPAPPMPPEGMDDGMDGGDQAGEENGGGSEGGEETEEEDGGMEQQQQQPQPPPPQQQAMVPMSRGYPPMGYRGRGGAWRGGAMPRGGGGGGPGPGGPGPTMMANRGAMIPMRGRGRMPVLSPMPGYIVGELDQ